MQNQARTMPTSPTLLDWKEELSNPLESQKDMARVSHGSSPENNWAPPSWSWTSSQRPEKTFRLVPGSLRGQSLTKGYQRHGMSTVEIATTGVQRTIVAQRATPNSGKKRKAPDPLRSTPRCGHYNKISAIPEDASHNRALGAPPCNTHQKSSSQKRTPAMYIDTSIHPYISSSRECKLISMRIVHIPNNPSLRSARHSLYRHDEEPPTFNCPP